MLRDDTFTVIRVFADGNPEDIEDGATIHDAIIVLDRLREMHPSRVFIGAYVSDDPERGYFSADDLREMLDHDSDIPPEGYHPDEGGRP